MKRKKKEYLFCQLSVSINSYAFHLIFSIIIEHKISSTFLFLYIPNRFTYFIIRIKSIILLLQLKSEF